MSGLGRVLINAQIAAPWASSMSSARLGQWFLRECYPSATTRNKGPYTFGRVTRQRERSSVVPSQLIELGQRALTDVRIGVANGEPLVRCQLLASEFYEALKRALRAPELSP